MENLFSWMLHKDNPNTIAIEDTYSPTSQQKAERILKQNAFFHFDPDTIEDAEIGNQVSSLSSTEFFYNYSPASSSPQLAI